ncbi:carbonic anhydrase family protein [Polaribacter sp. Z014]|uniref:carbonic anhydrase n=1 Tax=Polaribacter sp. Z014 TaxID=2927126 RepID=UPI002021A191|nr:carbonic anhydrase family protein [Polaribacter sp. Z014]MCL7764929.1 carbonic anhydrase family protein [Polaribacter sp. Z014]
MKKFIVTFLIFTLVTITSCNSDKKEKKNHQEENHAHWTYNGETSPEHWAEIEKNSDCDGKKQSPINIIDINTKPVQQKENSLDILYSPTTKIKQVINNGHSIQFNFEAGDSIQYHGDTYFLSQVHFHEPSEHTLNGVRFPLEIHLVHKSKSNKYTVMSILAKEGAESQLFEFFESFLPIEENKTKEIDQSLDLTTLFPKNNDFYAYGGSLTTPPCTERVNWVVFKDPIIISVDEVLKLKSNMPKDNYRNEQPLNDRIVSLNIQK